MIVEKFYKAFDELDHERMVQCYHKDIVFEDPAFGILKGDRAKNMWRMLCQSQKGKSFKVVASDIKVNGSEASAHWEAHYNFSKTGNKVHNIIDAKFELKDGLIVKHVDSFNLHRWASQALGMKGFLLAWTPFFKKKLNAQTKQMLTKFETLK